MALQTSRTQYLCVGQVTFGSLQCNSSSEFTGLQCVCTRTSSPGVLYSSYSEFRPRGLDPLLKVCREIPRLGRPDLGHYILIHCEVDCHVGAIGSRSTGVRSIRTHQPTRLHSAGSDDKGVRAYCPSYNNTFKRKSSTRSTCTPNWSCIAVSTGLARLKIKPASRLFLPVFSSSASLHSPPSHTLFLEKPVSPSRIVSHGHIHLWRKRRLPQLPQRLCPCRCKCRIMWRQAHCVDWF